MKPKSRTYTYQSTSDASADLVLEPLGERIVIPPRALVELEYIGKKPPEVESTRDSVTFIGIIAKVSLVEPGGGRRILSPLRRPEGVFVLSPSGDPRYFWGRVEGLDVDPLRLMRGEVTPSAPVHVHVEGGEEPGDFLWTDMGLIIISQKVLGILQRERCTGVSQFPVAVEAEGVALEGYTGLSVLGQALPRVNEDPAVFGTWRWWGDDVFVLPENPRTPVVVDRIAEALVRAKVTNLASRLLRYEPLEKPTTEAALKWRACRDAAYRMWEEARRKSQ